jgi:beta-glucosidase
MDSLAKYNPSFQPSTSDLAFIASNKPDFLGINFYAPAVVKAKIRLCR